jgi:hypothetical protein
MLQGSLYQLYIKASLVISMSEKKKTHVVVCGHIQYFEDTIA